MIYSLKSLLKTAFLSALFLTMCCLNGQAQTSSPSDLYVKIEGITPTEYGTIVKKFRLDATLSTKQACVPAELMIFGLDGDQNPEEAFSRIVELIKEVTDLESIEMLSGYTYEDFMSSCRAERGRTH